jgi:proteic killer suppression protein
MLDPNRITCRKLRRLVEKGQEQGIRAEWRPKVKRILAALHAATSPEELDLPGYRWHILKGDRKGTYAVSVSGNWRITYKWDDDGPYAVDLEEYHGK